MKTRAFIFGGVAAGLVLALGEYLLAVTLLGSDWDVMFLSLEHRSPWPGAAWFVVPKLAMGVVLMAVYVSLREQRGSGSKTALIVGLIGWGAGMLVSVIWLMAEGQCQSVDVKGMAMWRLLEIPAAVFIGAKVLAVSDLARREIAHSKQ